MGNKLWTIERGYVLWLATIMTYARPLLQPVDVQPLQVSTIEIRHFGKGYIQPERCEWVQMPPLDWDPFHKKKHDNRGESQNNEGNSSGGPEENSSSISISLGPHGQGYQVDGHGQDDGHAQDDGRGQDDREEEQDDGHGQDDEHEKHDEEGQDDRHGQENGHGKDDEEGQDFNNDNGKWKFICSEAEWPTPDPSSTPPTISPTGIKSTQISIPPHTSSPNVPHVSPSSSFSVSSQTPPQVTSTSTSSIHPLPSTFSSVQLASSSSAPNWPSPSKSSSNPSFSSTLPSSISSTAQSASSETTFSSFPSTSLPSTSISSTFLSKPLPSTSLSSTSFPSVSLSSTSLSSKSPPSSSVSTTTADIDSHTSNKQSRSSTGSFSSTSSPSIYTHTSSGASTTTQSTSSAPHSSTSASASSHSHTTTSEPTIASISLTTEKSTSPSFFPKSLSTKKTSTSKSTSQSLRPSSSTRLTSSPATSSKLPHNTHTSVVIATKSPTKRPSNASTSTHGPLPSASTTVNTTDMTDHERNISPDKPPLSPAEIGGAVTGSVFGGLLMSLAVLMVLRHRRSGDHQPLTHQFFPQRDRDSNTGSIVISFLQHRFSVGRRSTKYDSGCTPSTAGASQAQSILPSSQAGVVEERSSRRWFPKRVGSRILRISTVAAKRPNIQDVSPCGSQEGLVASNTPSPVSAADLKPKHAFDFNLDTAVIDRNSGKQPFGNASPLIRQETAPSDAAECGLKRNISDSTDDTTTTLWSDTDLGTVDGSPPNRRYTLMRLSIVSGEHLGGIEEEVGRGI